MKTLLTIFATTFLLLSTNNLFGQETEINIISVNDTHSNLSPGGPRNNLLQGTIGGLAKATTVINDAMQKDTNTLLLHAGDFVIGDLWFYLTYGLVEIEWMKMMGFDALTLGNHEFDGTVDMINNILNLGVPHNEIPILSANLQSKTEKGQLLIDKVNPYIIKEVNGVKVGIFGMTSPDANLTSLAAPDIYVADTDPETTVMIAGGQVQSLKEQGCDVVIFLSHLGIQFDRAIASAVGGIDLIIGAHDHLSFKQAEIIGNTHIIQSGAFLQQLGKTKIVIKDKKVEMIKYELVELNDKVEENPVIAQILLDEITNMNYDENAMFTLAIAQCEDNIDEYISDIFSVGPKSTGVGNLISNAFKSFGKTDIGFTTSGLSAQPLYKGNIVAQDVVKMLGYGLNETTGIGYNMVKFNIKGADLINGIMICFGAMAAYQNDEFLPQVAGMEVRYNPNDFTQFQIKVNGEKIDKNKTYSLTTSIFVATILSMNGIELSDYQQFDDISDFMVVLEYVMNMQLLNNNFENTVIADNEVSVGKDDNINFLIKNNNKLGIFPNPAKDMVNLNINQIMNGAYEIKAINISSLEIIDFGTFYFRDNESQISLNINNLTNGKYLLLVKGGKSVMTSFTVCK